MLGDRHAWPNGCLRLPPSRTLTVRAVDGTPLHAEVFGPSDGYPIVLSHGITCAIRAWAYQIADLAADYRVIAFDHRGHGRSGVPRRCGYSLKQLASDLDSVLEATLAPHERAILAGHSMGGITIAAWSARYRHKVPRRADAVALINTTTGDLVRQVKLFSVPGHIVAGTRDGRAQPDQRVRRVPDSERRVAGQSLFRRDVGGRKGCRPQCRETDPRIVRADISRRARWLREDARRIAGLALSGP